MSLDLSEAELDPQIPDYQIIHREREDLFALVFHARHNKLKKEVIIRILKLNAADFSQNGANFNDYFSSFVQFQHLNLAEIIDFGETKNGFLYVVSPMFEESVATVTFESFEQCEKVYRELLAVVGWLHEKNIVHGWINPGLLGINGEGALKLDGIGMCGIADLYGGELNTSSTSAYLGPENTPDVLNPSIQGDLYSIGVCLYQSLTGVLPKGIFQMPSELNPELGKSFDKAISTALQADPASRFACAEAFAQCLSETEKLSPQPKMNLKLVKATTQKAMVMAEKAKPVTGKTSTVTSYRNRQQELARREKSSLWAMVGIIIVIVLGIGGGFYLLSSPAGNGSAEVVDRSLPEKPEQLKATEIDTSSVTLDWQDSTDNVAVKHYKIYRNDVPVGTSHASDYWDPDLNPNARYTYRVSAVDAAGNESPLSPEIKVETIEENMSILIGKLDGLRMLYPHCPSVQKEIQQNNLLKQLVDYSASLGVIVENLREENPELISILESDDFVKFVTKIYDEALLPKPSRDIRAGTLIGWSGEKGSEKPAADFLENYSGINEGIVSVAGSIASGIALSKDGKVSTWGIASDPPKSLQDVISVDAENGQFAILTESGRVKVWGSSNIKQSDLDSWESVSGFSLGKNHILGVTENFKILAAGSNEFGQTKVPEIPNDGEPVIAVEAIGDRSYAITARGILFFWGKNGGRKKHTFGVPRRMQSSGNSVFINERYRNTINRLDKFGESSKLDITTRENDVVFIPEYSPNEELFAFHRGSSRWTLTNKSNIPVDMAYWQETARGAVDFIVGDDAKFIAIVPRVLATSPPSKGISRPLLEPSVKLVKVDEVEIPEIYNFRKWSPNSGKSVRARITGINDRTHLVLRLSDGSKAVKPIADFSPTDQAFAKRWIPINELSAKRFKDRLQNLSLEQYLSNTGYRRVDFLVNKGLPHLQTKVNGVDADLVIDTGASGTLVSAKIAEDAKIRLKEGSFATTWQGRVMVYEGIVRALKFGEVSLSSVKIGATDMSRSNADYDGLLGVDILKAGKAAFDFGNSQLIFHSPDKTDARSTTNSKNTYRTWTSIQGTAFRATLIGEAQGSEVKLQAVDESTKTVPVSALSNTDREYLDLLQMRDDFESSYREYRSNLNLGTYFAQRSNEWYELPATMQGAAQIVEVILDGRKFEFFVDTGAANSMLSMEAAKSLSRDTSKMTVVGMGGGLEGEQVPVYAGNFTSLQLGDRIFHDYRLNIYDFRNMVSRRYSGTEFDGVLGNDLLIRLKSIIDLRSNRVFFPKEN